ncbi:MAG: hypothetical protein HYU36_07010 [Planctomycetes bacterium]|nr:hypothetical protein [Planctomycetota bacterium]
MDDQKRPFLNLEIPEVVQMTFRGRALFLQFVGTFVALAIFYSALSIAFIMKYTMVSASIISLGLFLSYPLIAATLLITSSLQINSHPGEFRQFLSSLQTKLVRTCLGALLCAAITVFIAIPQVVLLKIGTAGDAGQVLLALFLVPLLGLTLLQLAFLFFGLFVLPQLLACGDGSPSELLQVLKEVLVQGGRKLVARHTVGIILSVLLALPFWLAIDFSAGVLGAMTTSLLGRSSPPQQPPADPSTLTSPSLVLPLVSQRITAFAPVWLGFNEVALYLTGLSATLAYSLPLAIAVLGQSATGLLALRTLTGEVEDMEYPPRSEHS